jgi:hypothetical protein
MPRPAGGMYRVMWLGVGAVAAVQVWACVWWQSQAGSWERGGDHCPAEAASAGWCVDEFAGRVVQPLHGHSMGACMCH